MSWAVMIERAHDRMERLREKGPTSPYDRDHVRLVGEELEATWLVVSPESVTDEDRRALELIERVSRMEECFRVRDEEHPVVIEWRWTDRVLREADKAGTPALCQHKKTSTVMVRDYKVPHCVIALSLPWWLLATDYEREAALHDVLTRIGRGGTLDKRDLVISEATASRYGVGARHHARAVHVAATHARTEVIVREWDADKHGQLVM
jgi:hypothetical protein